MRIEALDTRLLLAAVRDIDPADQLDVNRDGLVTPQDAIIVINRLNELGASENAADLQIDFDRDVNQDETITPLDALLVINWLN